MTLANEDLINKPMHCCVCTKDIDPDRLRRNRKAVTCSDECSELRIRMLRKNKDDAYCRFCHKPSTPMMRSMFTQFTRWMRNFPDVAMPELWKLAEAEGMTKKQFGRALVQAQKRDVILNPAYAELNWGSTKAPAGPDARPTPELDRVLEFLRKQAPTPEVDDAEKAA